jgi:uncharacterized protein YdaU (DUF1376 family)
MPLWIGDYLADTMHLTAAQHGAYLLLLMAHWRRRDGLPNDPDFLRQTARCTEAEWNENPSKGGLSIAQAMLAFFEVKDGKLIHKRLLAERLKADTRYAKLSAAGRKGGKAGLSEAKARLKQSQSHYIDSPIRAEVWAEPSREQVIEAARNCGLNEEQADIWLNDHLARPIAPDGRWTDRNGRPVNNWQASLAAWAGRWRQNDRDREAKASAPKFSGLTKGKADTPWEIKQRLEAITREIEGIRGDRRNRIPKADTPWESTMAPEAVERVKALKATAQELNRKLALSAKEAA